MSNTRPLPASTGHACPYNASHHGPTNAIVWQLPPFTWSHKHGTQGSVVDVETGFASCTSTWSRLRMSSSAKKMRRLPRDALISRSLYAGCRPALWRFRVVERLFVGLPIRDFVPHRTFPRLRIRLIASIHRHTTTNNNNHPRMARVMLTRQRGAALAESYSHEDCGM